MITPQLSLRCESRGSRQPGYNHRADGKRPFILLLYLYKDFLGQILSIYFYRSIGDRVKLDGKDVLLLFNNQDLDQNKICTIHIFMNGKYVIHTCRWAKEKPRFLVFKME